MEKERFGTMEKENTVGKIKKKKQTNGNWENENKHNKKDRKRKQTIGKFKKGNTIEKLKNGSTQLERWKKQTNTIVKIVKTNKLKI